jgi:hypothetical protein
MWGSRSEVAICRRTRAILSATYFISTGATSPTTRYSNLRAPPPPPAGLIFAAPPPPRWTNFAPQPPTRLTNFCATPRYTNLRASTTPHRTTTPLLRTMGNRLSLLLERARDFCTPTAPGSTNGTQPRGPADASVLPPLERRLALPLLRPPRLAQRRQAALVVACVEQ